MQDGPVPGRTTDDIGEVFTLMAGGTAAFSIKDAPPAIGRCPIEAARGWFGCAQAQLIGQQRRQLRTDKIRELIDPRSEEHTSELQSLRHLVCRLLLEKKKRNTAR